MTFDVLWLPEAEADLAAIWLAARDRHRLTEVCERIEGLLGTFAPNVGESREPGVRIVLDDPLGVRLEVDARQRSVRVLAVWRTDRR